MAQRVTNNHTLIAESLHLFTPNWEVLTKDQWVINCIQGYTIDITRQPVQNHVPKELAFDHTQLENLSKEVGNTLAKQVLTPVPKEQTAKGFHSQLFSVPKKDGDIKPRMNLKGLNLFVETVHFKMEGIHMLKDILKHGDWMTKVDLKDSYFMIPMAPNQRRLLRFKWQGTAYQFNCLPVQLPTIWTVVSTMGLYQDHQTNSEHPQNYGSEDDYIHRRCPDHGRDETSCKRTHCWHDFSLENLGFIINHPKSLLNPTQEIDFLGFTINSRIMDIRMPREKI